MESGRTIESGARRAFRWSACALLCVLLAVQILRRGPLRLEAPEFVLSNGVGPQRASIPFLRFLRSIAPHLPRESTVAILYPDAGRDIIPYLIAIGQLPDQNVLPPAGLGENPEWVACFGEAPGDPRYRPVVSVEGGSLLHRER